MNVKYLWVICLIVTLFVMVIARDVSACSITSDFYSVKPSVFFEKAEIVFVGKAVGKESIVTASIVANGTYNISKVSFEILKQYKGNLKNSIDVYRNDYTSCMFDVFLEDIKVDDIYVIMVSKNNIKMEYGNENKYTIIGDTRANKKFESMVEAEKFIAKACNSCDEIGGVKRAIPYTRKELRKLLPANCINFFDGCNSCSGNVDKDAHIACTKKTCFDYRAPKCFKIKKQNNTIRQEYQGSWLTSLFKKIEVLQGRLQAMVIKVKKLLNLYTDDSLANKATSETLTTEFTYNNNSNITVSLQHLTSPIQVDQEVAIQITTTSTGCAIRKADFVINGEIIGSDSEKPFEFKWKPIQKGEYVVKAVVKDCNGLAAYATKKIVVADGGTNTDTTDTETYTKEDVSTHNKEGDCWVILNDQVFDMSEQSKIHPTMFTCGGDGTENYKRQHGEVIGAAQMKYKIGEIKNDVAICSSTNCEKLTAQTELFVAAGNWNNKNLIAVLELENDATVSMLFIDSETRKAVGRIKSVGGKHGNFVASSDGKFAYYVARNNFVAKIDLSKLEVVNSIKIDGRLSRIKVTKDGRVLAVGDESSNKVTFIYTRGMMIGHSVDLQIADIEVVGNDFILMSKSMIFKNVLTGYNQPSSNGSGGGFIKKEKIIQIGQNGDVASEGFLSADRKYYLAIMKSENKVWVLDIANKMKVIAKFSVGKLAKQGISIGDKIFVPSADNIAVIDTNTWKMTNMVTTPTPILFLRSFVAGNKNRILAKTVPVSRNANRTKRHEFYVFDVQTLKLIKTIESTAGKYVSMPTFTADKKNMYVAISVVGKVHIYDLQTFKPIANVDTKRPFMLYGVSEKTSGL